MFVVGLWQVSSAGWCCSIDDGEGLWYTDEYPEEVFFEHWTMLAERYLDNPWVIGADLRNEIRAIPGISTKIASIFIMAFTINFSSLWITSDTFLLCLTWYYLNLSLDNPAGEPEP